MIDFVVMIDSIWQTIFKKMDKKITFKTWVSVLLGGIGQFFRNIFSWKNKTLFWRVICATITVCVVIATAILCHAYYLENNQESYWVRREPISSRLQFMKEEDRNRPGWIADKNTGQHILDNIEWVAVSADEDSLAVFSRNGKRGYLNRYSGKIAIQPRFDSAWVFSNGLAAVAEGDSVYFIDHSGKRAIDKSFVRKPRNAYLFHGDYCLMNDSTDMLGLIDRNGEWALAPEYDWILPATHNYWRMRRGDKETGLWYAFDNHAQPVDTLGVQQLDITAELGVIYTLPNHLTTIIDFDGNRHNDFLCHDIEPLYYDSDQRDSTGSFISAPATLYRYRMPDGYEGLCRRNGELVTDPVYWMVESVGKDLYHCTYKDTGCGVLIDSNGKITSLRP